MKRAPLGIPEEAVVHLAGAIVLVATTVEFIAYVLTRIPNPDRRQQHDPSVTDDRTVHLVRSGRSCGAAVRLVRPQAGPSKVLASLGARRDPFHTYARENDGGTSTLFCVSAARRMRWTSSGSSTREATTAARGATMRGRRTP